MATGAVTGMVHEAGAFGADPVAMVAIALLAVILGMLVCHYCIKRWFKSRMRKAHKSLSK